MIPRWIMVYGLKVFSGLASLLILLIIATMYGPNEVARYAVFMFALNMAAVIAVWGRNIQVVDALNTCSAAKKSNGVEGGDICLDIVITSVATFFIMQLIGKWNPGLLAVFPIAIGVIMAAALTVRSKPCVSVLINEFGRAILPVAVMGLLFCFDAVISFEQALSLAYASCFIMVPIFIIFNHRCSIFEFYRRFSFAAWCREKYRLLPVVIPQILFVMAAQADRLVISVLGETTDLAAYFSAQTLYLVVIFAIQAIFVSVVPNMSRVAHDGEGSLRKEGRMVLYAYLALASILTPVSVVYFNALNMDVKLSLIVFALLLCSGLSFLFGVGFQAMQYCNEKKSYLQVTFVGVIGQGGFTYLFYDVFGVCAAAIGFIVYSFFTSIAGWLFWKRRSVSVLPFNLNFQK